MGKNLNYLYFLKGQHFIDLQASLTVETELSEVCEVKAIWQNLSYRRKRQQGARHSLAEPR